MVNKSLIWRCFGIFLLFGLQSVIVAAAQTDPWANNRKLFKRALHAAESARIKEYQEIESQLAKYPLYPYLVYAFLRTTIDKRKNLEVKKFLELYQDMHLSGRLRSRWLHELARRGYWLTFIREYKPRQSETLQCHYAYALFLLDRDEEAEIISRNLWLIGRSRPDACDKAFKLYQRSGLLAQKTIWKRAALAMKNRNTVLAQYLMTLMENEQDRLWLQRWINMHWQPDIMLSEPAFLFDRDIVREIVVHGIKRIGKRDLDKAWAAWQASKQIYQYEPEVITDLEQHLALSAGYRRHPKALEWFAGLLQMDKDTAQWRIRLALRQGEWEQALKWITALSAGVREQEKWQYWHARCLQELGKRDSRHDQITKALSVFTKLAKKRSYFGFLAADQIGGDYQLQLQPANYQESDLKQVANLPGIIRSKELFKLQMYTKARQEWDHTTSKLSSKQLKLASALANRWGWYDRAIFAFAKSGALATSNVSLPYPVAFRGTVLKNAKHQKIDPAWIYGVVRQESAFMFDAKSHAGAMGLMQLMPNTAKFVSRMTKTPLRKNRDLFLPEKNIRLGSAYLKYLLDKHDGNAVLATASYNAGDSRIFKWLPDEAIAADIWVESIPFTETRDYVGKVLGYTVIFDHLLHGEALRLEKRMPIIVPNKSN